MSLVKEHSGLAKYQLIATRLCESREIFGPFLKNPESKKSSSEVADLRKEKKNYTTNTLWQTRF